jgi:hypothetical protein
MAGKPGHDAGWRRSAAAEHLSALVRRACIEPVPEF